MAVAYVQEPVLEARLGEGEILDEGAQRAARPAVEELPRGGEIERPQELRLAQSADEIGLVDLTREICQRADR